MLERFHLQIDIFHQASATDILQGDIDSGLGNIGAIAMESELTLPALIIINTIEQFLIIVHPFLESELFPMDTRSDIQGDHGSLDQQCTGTTHRIYEIRFSFPTGF